MNFKEKELMVLKGGDKNNFDFQALSGAIYKQTIYCF